MLCGDWTVVRWGLGDESQKEKGERLDERVSKQFREKTVA